MKYSLRNLMIVVLVLPPLLAVGWWRWKSISWDEPPPRIPLSFPKGIRGPHVITPSYNNREATKFMLNEERKGRTWKTIGN